MAILVVCDRCKFGIRYAQVDRDQSIPIEKIVESEGYSIHYYAYKPHDLTAQSPKRTDAYRPPSYHNLPGIPIDLCPQCMVKLLEDAKLAGSDQEGEVSL